MNPTETAPAELTVDSTPYEVDMELARLYNEAVKLEHRAELLRSDVLSLAGAKFYYRGRRRVTDMTVEDAIVTVNDELAKMDAWASEHTYTDGGYSGVKWVGYEGIIQPYDRDRARDWFAKWIEIGDALEANYETQMRIEAELFTGWSRFFLVTSSAGHIHSSMHCSTCRPKTTYGWLPALSGKAEAEAVAEHGPALCSVCFPSAPVAMVGGKITKAKAAKAAA